MMFFSYGKLGEVTENIPIFARASRTQTQTNTQPNMHKTHNPSSITHHLSEKHTFSSKERDVETGLSYFGARYYSSDLSIWLSVDPNGEEIGDFFDLKGRYLGTDGIVDEKIYITTQEDWTNCSQLENGTTLITIPQLGFSRKPSQVNLSDEAMLNIYQHYNNTDYSLKAMDRGVAVSNTASERRAITTQMYDSSFSKTRPAFQEAVKEYGRRNMMKCN